MASRAEDEKKWPVTMVLTLHDASHHNCFRLTISVVEHINNQLVDREIEVLKAQGNEILLHDSDTGKAYPYFKLIGFKNKNIYSSYYLRGTNVLVMDRGLKPGDTVRFRYNHRLGVLFFSVLNRVCTCITLLVCEIQTNLL